MHEQALVNDLLRRIEEVAKTENARRITHVRLWVGALSHVTGDWLRTEWPRVTEGTRAEGSVLEVEVSRDLDDPRAQAVVLTSLDVSPS